MLLPKSTTMLRLIKRKIKQDSIVESKQAVVFPLQSANRKLDQLIDLIKKIRPSSPENIVEAETKFKALLFQLSEETASVISLRKALLSQLVHSNIVEALTESGVITSRGFIQEFLSRLKHKLIPSLTNPDDFLYVINRVFYKRSDYLWVMAVDKMLWKSLFELIGVSISMDDQHIVQQLQEALQILSYRITALALEKDMLHHHENKEEVLQPLIDQNHWVQQYLSETSSNGDERLLINIETSIQSSTASIRKLKLERVKYGTSLAQIYLMTRLEQQIARLSIVAGILDVGSNPENQRIIEFFTSVIRFENTKNSVGTLISDLLQLVSNQIAGHEGKKIARLTPSNSKEYSASFSRSLAGGAFAALIVVSRRLIGMLSILPFYQGFLYSVNYSSWFIIMDKSNATLASRQLPYTTSVLASSSPEENDNSSVQQLASTVRKVCKNQALIFAGNMLLVFPATCLLAWLYAIITGTKMVSGDAAMRLLDAQHPLHSGALIFAAVTGVFIFLSGLIAGYVENHVVYGAIGARLQQHPVLQQTMSKKRLSRIVNIATNNSGMLAGALSLGIFFGFASMLGHVVGIPFDIRQVTLSAADVTLGFFGVGHTLQLGYVITIISGVLLIGIVNFLVSFSLAFYIAMKSRGMVASELPSFFKALFTGR